MTPLDLYVLTPIPAARARRIFAPGYLLLRGMGHAANVRGRAALNRKVTR